MTSASQTALCGMERISFKLRRRELLKAFLHLFLPRCRPSSTKCLQRKVVSESHVFYGIPLFTRALSVAQV